GVCPSIWLTLMKVDLVRMISDVLFAITLLVSAFFIFFNDTATSEIYTLSLHDALPIWHAIAHHGRPIQYAHMRKPLAMWDVWTPDRKSTRLNSSHVEISYAVFCLKKKNKPKRMRTWTD